MKDTTPTFRRLAIVALVSATLISLAVGCGSGAPAPPPPGTPIDPSGNWSMKFTDANGGSLLLSALFSQTGSVVSGLNILAVGNVSPFSCVPFSATFANGQVVNVDQFSGDIDTQFGNIHFASTLNAQGSHADGTYTLTGSCWGVAATGSFSADEIPSVSGSWSGTITCTNNCPAGPTAGTITATLTQDDATGQVNGSYSVTGLPNIGNGNVSTVGQDFLSGPSWQDTFTDNNGNVYFIAGGPFNGQGDAGLTLDRKFSGQIFETHDAGNASVATYSVSMSH